MYVALIICHSWSHWHGDISQTPPVTCSLRWRRGRGLFVGWPMGERRRRGCLAKFAWMEYSPFCVPSLSLFPSLIAAVFLPRNALSKGYSPSLPYFLFWVPWLLPTFDCVASSLFPPFSPPVSSSRRFLSWLTGLHPLEPASFLNFYLSFYLLFFFLSFILLQLFLTSSSRYSNFCSSLLFLFPPFLSPFGSCSYFLSFYFDSSYSFFFFLFSFSSYSYLILFCVLCFFSSLFWDFMFLFIFNFFFVWFLLLLLFVYQFSVPFFSFFFLLVFCSAFLFHYSTSCFANSPSFYFFYSFIFFFFSFAPLLLPPSPLLTLPWIISQAQVLAALPSFPATLPPPTLTPGIPFTTCFLLMVPSTQHFARRLPVFLLKFPALLPLLSILTNSAHPSFICIFWPPFTESLNSKKRLYLWMLLSDGAPKTIITILGNEANEKGLWQNGRREREGKRAVRVFFLFILMKRQISTKIQRLYNSCI